MGEAGEENGKYFWHFVNATKCQRVLTVGVNTHTLLRQRKLLMFLKSENRTSSIWPKVMGMPLSQQLFVKKPSNFLERMQIFTGSSCRTFVNTLTFAV